MVQFWLGLLLFVDGVVMTAAGAAALSVGAGSNDISGAILAGIGAAALIAGIVIWIVGYIKRKK